VDSVAATIDSSWGSAGVAFARASTSTAHAESIGPVVTAVDARTSAALADVPWHGIAGYSHAKLRLLRLVVWPLRFPTQLRAFGVR
jgi:hypothetical protein